MAEGLCCTVVPCRRCVVGDKAARAIRRTRKFAEECVVRVAWQDRRTARPSRADASMVNQGVGEARTSLWHVHPQNGSRIAQPVLLPRCHAEERVMLAQIAGARSVNHDSQEVELISEKLTTPSSPAAHFHHMHAEQLKSPVRLRSFLLAGEDSYSTGRYLGMA